MNDEALPLRMVKLRAQIAELSGAIRQLQRAGLGDAVSRLLILRNQAELDDLSLRVNRRSKEAEITGLAALVPQSVASPA
jgi:hypothetical protein